MLPYRRSQRVGDLLRREVSDIILTRVKDPRIGFITVTDLELTDDLKVARVYISVLDQERPGAKKNQERPGAVKNQERPGAEKKRDQMEYTLKVLRGATGFIRHELAMSVDLRRIPALEFFSDRSIEYGSRIDGILRQIKEEEG
ncbi:MAG: ribosome-binding factor A [Nitrospirae bacterium]|nr:ribosome-binding factor A [Nitrospirota bacterium]